MSHMNELSGCLSDLKKAVSLLESSIATLTETFSAQEPAPAESATVKPAMVKPAPKPITKEEVRAVLAAKSASGYTAQVRALLKQHGASQLSSVDPDDYADLLREASSIGNEVRSDG